MTFLIHRVDSLLWTPGTSLARYILTVGWIAAVPGAMLVIVAALSGATKPISPVPGWGFPDRPMLRYGLGVFDALVLSPLIETALAFIPIWVLGRLKVPKPLIPIAAGILWGFLHCRFNGPIGFVAAWPFFCFSVVLMALEARGRDRAWLAASAVHTIVNVVGLVVGAALSMAT